MTVDRPAWVSHAKLEGYVTRMDADSDAVALRIFLRPIGSPLTLGMAGLGIASLVQSGFDLHWISLSQSPEVGLILLAVPFFLQGVAAVLSYLARDGAAGAALGILSTSWLAVALVHLASGPPRSGALGLMLLASAGMLMLTAAAIGTGKLLPAMVFMVEAVRFGLGGIYALGGSGSWAAAVTRCWGAPMRRSTMRFTTRACARRPDPDCRGWPAPVS